MTKGKTQIDGLAETIRALESMGKLDLKPIKSNLRKEGQKIIDTAKSRCQNTNVREAIGFITKNESRYPAGVLIGIQSFKGSSGLTNPAMASLMEFGSTPRYTKDFQWRGQVAARPFMRPAYDQHKNSIKKNVENHLIDLIQKEGKKLNLK